MNRTFAALLTGFSALAFASQASAVEMVYNPYVGINYNYSDARAKGVSPYYNSASFNIGTSYNRYFGTEMFYQYTDSYTKKSQSKLSSDFQAYGLDLMAYMPVGCYERVNLIGTVGLGEYHFNNEVGHANNEDSGLGYRAGLGVQYDIDNNWTVRSVARYVGLDGVKDFDHMMEYSLGLKYNF